MEPNRTQKRTMQSIYNKTLFNIILLALFFCGASTVVKADTTIYSTGFEDTTQNAKWSADNGVWELGAPTSGPKAAHDGTQVAGTILAGNYPTWKASNLISPSIVLPTINAGEQISLKFWHWFSFGGADSNGRNPSYGHVNVATWDAVNKKWNASVQIPSSPTFYGGSSVWSQVVLDLSSFAGQKIQLQFHHDGQVNSGAGWYIDEVQVIRETIVELPLNIPVTFESATAHDWGGWWADQGVWELGIPTSGPGIAHESKQVAGTVLAGNYPNWQGSGLISPSITLPALNAGEQLSLKFWHWFSYGGADSNGRNPSYGQVHISTWDATKKQWSGWTAISQRYDAGSSGWHYTGTNFTPLALTAYAGKRVRFDFYHSGQVNSGAGWYIDEVKVSREPIPTPISPNKPVTFEGLGFTTEDWQGIAADNGIWEVGIPGAPGPKSAHEGQNVVGTILQGGYPNWRGSGLITPSIIVPPIGSNDELHLRYWHWFRYGGADSNGRNPSYGQVHISTWDATKMKWSDWTAISPQYMGDSGGWTQPLLDITAYAGKTIRFNFYHSGQVNSGAGWYLDEITVLLPSPTITGFTPDHGPVDTLVTITGTYFTGATSVKFNGVDAKSFNVSDDGTTIYAVVKEGTTTGKITVVTPSDTVTSDNPFTVSSGAIVTGITLKPSVVYGGQSVSGTVTISDIAPSGGADVTLQPNSSLLDTLTVKVPAGSTIGTFSMIAKRTATSTKVTLTATLNGISKSADVTINPWTQTVTLSPTTVIGGVANSTGVVTLMAKAPAGGLTVTLKSSDIAVGTVLPTSITIPEGKKSGVFTITTYKVTSTKKLVITATTDTDATATLTVQAQVIGTLVLIPNSVTGGDDSIGIVTLTNAATQDTTVTLKSSNEAVATVVQSTGLKSVVIKAGEKSATFTIDTKTVTAAASVTINATLNGVKLSAALKVTP